MSAAFKTVDFFTSLFQMFLAHSRIHSFSPKFETRFFQFRAHQFNYLRFADSELKFYGFKRRSVFPRHFNDSVDLFYVEVFIHFLTFIVRSFDKLRMTSLILTFTLCCQAVLVEAFLLLKINSFISFLVKNHFIFPINSFAVLKCCFRFSSGIFSSVLSIIPNLGFLAKKSLLSLIKFQKIASHFSFQSPSG